MWSPARGTSEAPAGPRTHDEPLSAAADTEDDVLGVWAAAGDQAAAAELYRRYRPMVAGHLYGRSIAPDDVDDLVQEVFVSCLELLRSGGFQDGPFRRWLFGHVVAKTLTGYFSRRWSGDQAAAGARAALLLPPPSITETRPLSAPLAAALTTLPARGRQLVELRYLEGQSGAATALVTGLTENTVHVVTSRAVAILRKTLLGSAKATRPALLSFDEHLRVAFDVADDVQATGGSWSKPTLIAAFKARGVPVGNARAGALVHAVRAARPDISSHRPAGLAGWTSGATAASRRHPR